MPITGLASSRRRNTRLPILALISGGLLLAALLLFILELGRFAQGRDLLQTDITVAKIPMPTGLKVSELAPIWQDIYDQPVELDYNSNRILLRPSEIGWHINSELMVSDITSKLSSKDDYWGDFWNYLWRKPTTPISVDLLSDYNNAKLRSYLTDLAARYGQQASGAAFDNNTLSFGSGAAGSGLDIDQAINDIDAVLHQPTGRKVKLPLKGQSAIAATMDTLKEGILSYLTSKGILLDAHDDNSIVGSIVIIDLQTRRELSINPDVAYSAMSTIKIPVMINIFRKLNLAPDVNTKWLMGASILCSSNSASNYLIQESGIGSSAGDQLANGLTQVTDTVQTVGATHTYIDAPLYVGDPKYQFSVGVHPPAPADKTFNAKPDLYSQTTAEDMAIMLQQIYDCYQYGSGLKAIFPDGFTQVECKQMINLLSGNEIGRLIELGVPAGTKVAHKNGWGGTATSGANVSDAGIVFSPDGAYVLAIYMWEPHANQDGIGTLKPWEAIEGISQIVYNYFNPDQPMVTPRVPENPLGAIDCVMPNPNHPELLDLNNINNGRFDADGHIVPDACFNYPQCGAIPAAKASMGNTSAPVAPTATLVNSSTATQPAESPTTSISTATSPPPPPDK